LRIGRRGLFLLFLALLDILYGWSLLASPPLALGLPLHLILPQMSWAWLWISTGLFLVPGAFLKADRLFFALAAFLKAAWAGAWVDVWLSDAFFPRAWVSVVIWGAFAGVVVVIATWPEVRTIKGGH
jgi:hypothetical protein